MEKNHKIGIIGVYPYALGGYDYTPIKAQHAEIFQSILSSYSKPTGITSLTIGSELDFAEICYKNNIPFHHIAIQEDGAHKWPADREKFAYLKQNADETIILSEGIFAPSKVFKKWDYVIRESDALIVILNPTYKFPTLINTLTDSGKTFYLCPTS